MSARQGALLVVRDLVVEYPSPGGPVRAVDGVSFEIQRGETLALVGESGSGKTSLGRAILRLVDPAVGSVSGSVSFDGTDLLALSGEPLRRMRRRAQVVFQDPKASLDPRMSVGRIIREGIDIHLIATGADADARVARLLGEVGLSVPDAERHPDEFSGGERQRIAIARALAVEPDFLVLDEAVSALDAIVREQVLDLLGVLQAQRALTYLFIAHDLGVVERIASRVAVMQRGRIVECAPTRQLFDAPAAAYTQSLLAAIPRVPW
jgi:peptide/nickel transport system ATP-binding protein/oligopeptide transport system ATP-binding protein